jgi:excisionase family DNA binding protein
MSLDLREGFLTVTEVAKYLRISKMTIYRFANDGTIRSIRVGNSIRIPESAAAEYLAALENKQEETPA